MTTSLSPKRLMIIDDDPDDIELFGELLQLVQPPTLLSSATNGEKALSQILEHKDQLPDLIFLDINMPVMNGIDFLKAIKSQPDYRHIPVLVHTTTVNPEFKQTARQLGIVGFITKYDEYDQMKQMLELVVDKLATNQIDDLTQAFNKD